MAVAGVIAAAALRATAMREREDSGAGATVTFDGKTKDGVGLKGTIRCHTVLRNG